MPDDGEIRAVSWSQTLGFVRLFRAFLLAIAPMRLSLCVVGLIVMYAAFRALDGVWSLASSEHGVIATVEGGRETTEITAYGSMSWKEFEEWRRKALAAAESAQVAAVDDLTDASGEKEARERLATASAASLIREANKAPTAEVKALLKERREAALAAIRADTALSSKQRAERERAVRRASDCILFVLHEKDPARYFTAEERARAAETLVDADPQLTAVGRAEALARFGTAVMRQTRLMELRRLERRSVFMSLLQHQTSCLSGCVEGLFAGRIGIEGTPASGRPSMLGSFFAAANGLVWLFTQRPIFAVVAAALGFAGLSLFGGAICRMMAIEAAREEYVSMSNAIRFSIDKARDFIWIPGIIVGVGLAAWLVLAAGGLVGALPWIGATAVGVLMPIALIAGLALAFWLVLALLGLPLMWPTIAVEGSDAMDAMSRGFSYAGQRWWLSSFYYALLIAFGGVCFVVIRLIAMLTLKFAHSAAAAGMSFFGTFTSGATETIGALDALWQMPAWSDLSLLPRAVGEPFWGVFGTAPLTGGEWAGVWLMCFWVYVLVGAVGAFVVNFALAGFTQMYFLLRRDVDSTDYSEVFVDDEPDDLYGASPAASAPSSGSGARPPGTALPVLPSDQAK